MCRFRDSRSIDLVNATFTERETLFCGSNVHVRALPDVFGSEFPSQREKHIIEPQQDMILPTTESVVGLQISTNTDVYDNSLHPPIVTPENDCISPMKKINCYAEIDNTCGSKVEVKTLQSEPLVVYESVQE